MGIYIKGMEMPKDDQKIRFIKLLNGKMYALKETRNGWPLSYLHEVIEVTDAFIPILATVRSSSMLVHQRQLFPKWNKLTRTQMSVAKIVRLVNSTIPTTKQ